MGAGPIPWRATRAWADEHDITTPDGFDDFVAIVQHLDAIWLKHTSAKTKEAMDKGRKK